MKNKLIILFVFSCLLGSFTSFYGCQEGEVSPPIVEGFPEDGKVSITTDVVEKASRTTSQTYLGEDLGLSLDYGVGHKYSVANIEWNQVDGVWQGVEQMLWADATTPTHLYAYAPYVIGANDMSAIPFTVASDQQTDTAMLASDLVGYVANGFVPVDSDPTTPSLDERGRVAIAFSHKLSRLDLRLSLGDQFDGTGVTVTQVEVMGMNHAALYDATTGGVSINATTPVSTPVIMQRQGDGSYRAIVVPQTIATGETMLQVTLSNSAVYGYTVNVADGHTFASGATHSMHLRVGKNKLELDGEVVVESWPMGEEITGGEGSMEWDEIAYSEMSVDNYPSSNYWKITGVIDNYNTIKAVLSKVNREENKRPIHILLSDQIVLENLSSGANNSVVSLLCPNVRTIREETFYYMYDLREISIPRVEKLEGDVFSTNGELTRIDVSNSPNYVFEDGALLNKAKTELIIYLPKEQQKIYTAPSTLRTVSNNAFQYNNFIEEIILSNVDTLKNNVFYSCRKLKKIHCPNLKQMGSSCIAVCGQLKEIDVSNSPNYSIDGEGGLYNKDQSVLYYHLKRSIVEYIAPVTLKKIDSYVFNQTISLTKVILSNVEELSSSTFSQTSLEVVEGEYVKKMGNYTFRSCRRLERVNFPNVIKLESSVLAGCISLRYVRIATHSILEYIGSDTFSSVNTEQVTLVTSSNNGTEIEGKFWKVVDQNGQIHSHGPFKEIIVENNN